MIQTCHLTGTRWDKHVQVAWDGTKTGSCHTCHGRPVKTPTLDLPGANFQQPHELGSFGEIPCSNRLRFLKKITTQKKQFPETFLKWRIFSQKVPSENLDISHLLSQLSILLFWIHTQRALNMACCESISSPIGSLLIFGQVVSLSHGK